MKRNAASPSDTSVESKESKQPSLMEQLKDHYNDRDFTAKPHHLHRMGLFTYLYCLLAVPLYCSLYTLPLMDLSLAQWIAITALSLFVMAENLANFIVCVNRHHNKDVVFCFHCNQTNQVVAKSNSDASAATGWRDCLKCQMSSPPRSHHCKLCGECVLRRDHHCYFLCCCIGHHNQKHFLVLCLYSIVGLLLGCYFVAVGIVMDQPSGAWGLLLPVTVWNWALAGSGSFSSILLVLSLYLQAGCLGVTCVYLFLESVLVLRGQTFHEMGHNIRRYNLGLWGNLRACLGSWYWWPLLMLYPFETDHGDICDGVNWQITKHY